MSLQTATGSSCLMAGGVGEAEAESKHSPSYVVSTLCAAHAQVPRCSMLHQENEPVCVGSTLATHAHT